MIEFGGQVRDVLVHHRALHRRARRTTPPTSCCASRAARRGCCSARSRPRRRFSFTLFGTKGLAEFSKPNLARFRFVPVSTVAPTGPVTAPPDEIIEQPGVRHAQRRAGRIRALHRGETALPGRRSTRCCTAWRCSTPWYGRRKSGKIETVRLRKRHGKADHHGGRRLAHLLPAQQPLPAAGGHPGVRAAIRRRGEGRRRDRAHPRPPHAGRNDPGRRQDGVEHPSRRLEEAAPHDHEQGRSDHAVRRGLGAHRGEDRADEARPRHDGGRVQRPRRILPAGADACRRSA